MTKKIDKLIEKARPSLRTVSPLAYWTILVMSMFNLVLGLLLIFVLDSSSFKAPLLIVNDVFSYSFWGFIFIVIGILKAYALIANKWRLARNTLFIGVSIKAAWMVALVVRMFISPDAFLFGLLWFTIASLQIGAYIWFMPPEILIGTGRKQEEKI